MSVNGSPSRTPDSSLGRVLIIGGGFAAVEAMLALRALAGDRTHVTVVSPDPVLWYRPAATLESFEPAPARRYDLRVIADDVGAVQRSDRLEAVAAGQHRVRTASGAWLEYDALVLAVGARATGAVPGAITFRDQRDARAISRVVAEFDAGTVRRMAFAAPAGCVWTLPLYELALLCARHAERRDLDVRVSVVTPERAPLARFGPSGSLRVRALLAEQGVHFYGATIPAAVRRDGSLGLAFGGALRADRVVAVPTLRGRRITGVPAGWSGFAPVDMLGRVEGLVDVYAAGDMTTFPIKQGGLATQQADRVAHTVASSLGAPVRGLRATHVLETRLVGGDQPLLLRTELDWRGEPTPAARTAPLERPGESGEPDSAKVLGRYLTPYLDAAGDRALITT